MPCAISFGFAFSISTFLWYGVSMSGTPPTFVATIAKFAAIASSTVIGRASHLEGST